MLIALAILYFVIVAIGEWRSGFVYRWVPGPILYFTQIAGLFTESKQADVEFRAEGWSCRDGLFQEMDVDADFPIQAGNKENRFQRAVYFYSHNAKVMSQLDRFLTQRHNARVPASQATDTARVNASRDSTSSIGSVGPISAASPATPVTDLGRIGGVRIRSAITPIPTPEEGARKYVRRPLSEYAYDHLRTLYETPSKTLWERCQEPE